MAPIGRAQVPLTAHCDAQTFVAFSGVGIRTIDFAGEATCDVPVLMELKTELRLNTTNSLEAQGNDFSGPATHGRSAGRFALAVAGSQHRFVYDFRLTTIDGRVFRTHGDPRCVGDGTTSIHCVVSSVITA
jgi:hypothetical protein